MKKRERVREESAPSRQCPDTLLEMRPCSSSLAGTHREPEPGGQHAETHSKGEQGEMVAGSSLGNSDRRACESA